MATDDDSIQAAAQAFENMTDEEATAWLAAGDYTSVAGISLPERASQTFAALASGKEVEGSSFDLDPLAPAVAPMPSADVARTVTAENLMQHCCTGVHLKKVLLKG